MQSQSLPALSLDQSQLDDSMLKEIKDVSSLASTMLKAIIILLCRKKNFGALAQKLYFAAKTLLWRKNIP